jgi:hypothetical protein
LRLEKESANVDQLQAPQCPARLRLLQRSGVRAGRSAAFVERWCGAGDGGLAMLVWHDDAKREYAYGPAQKLPDSKIGTFPQTLYDEAKAKGWFVISMKNDWKSIFAFKP